MYEVWIVSEYADRGSLADALRSGLLEGTEGLDMVSSQGGRLGNGTASSRLARGCA